METPKKPPPPAHDLLYERCNKDAEGSSERFKKIFTQDDLLSLCSKDENEKYELGHINDGKSLVPLIQELAGNMLFITLKSKTGGTCWGLRPREAASKVCGLGADEKMVYTAIEEAHETGIWIRNIKKRTGIADSKAMDRLVGRLQTLNLVKNVKSARAPAQKTYMLYHLAPSDEVTGGSFYDAGDLDESLVEELGNLIVFHVRQMSWVDVKKKRFKRESSPILIRDDVVDDQTAAAPPAGKKRKRDKQPARDIEDSAVTAPAGKKPRQTHEPDTQPQHTQLSHPPGHSYPDTTAIHKYVTTIDALRAVKAASLTLDEMQNVINILVWDEKLEEVNGGYRTVRGVRFDPKAEMEAGEEGEGSALMEMPCGRCPVIDLCGPPGVGAVSAESCVYFERWLEKGGGDVAAAAAG